jgi:hypothetical protein
MYTFNTDPMKKFTAFAILGLAAATMLVAFKPGPKGKSTVPAKQPVLTNQYIVVAWNDLGMHCSNLDFSNMCILPPYNNQKAQVIQKGDQATLPMVMMGSGGINVTYEIPGNTESATKTNFWSYSQHIFGVTLPPNIGLTGVGMAGTMQTADTINYHHVEGIPITAFPDATPTIPDAYQLTLIKAWSLAGQVLATTQSVIPVAHEINCVSSGCHSSEMAILQGHDQVQGFNIADKPILCANCHSDNALGTAGQPGVPPFSQVIHMKHGEFIKTGTNTDCYKCHPGPNTQCWRDTMKTATTGNVHKCQDCHGSVFNVGKTIENGREPWLEEPSCGKATCHGPNYAEEPGKLFRNSKGHGGLYCSACHGSPHAIFPTSQPRDNVQNIALQGYAGTLKSCAVCHGYTPSGPGPHGIQLTNTTLQNITVSAAQTSCYNATGSIKVAGNGTAFSVLNGGNATIIAGQSIAFLPGTHADSGSYMHGYITTHGQYCTTPAFPVVSSIPGKAITGDGAGSSCLKVYPNPANDIFYLEFCPTGVPESGNVEIYGTQGEKVLTTTLTGNGRHELSLAGRPAGIYMIRVYSGDRIETRKVIKQ